MWPLQNKQVKFVRVFVRPCDINEGRKEWEKRKEAQPGKRQCMSRARTGSFSVDSSIHALLVPCLCLSLAVPFSLFSLPPPNSPFTECLSPPQLVKTKSPTQWNCLYFLLPFRASCFWLLQLSVCTIYNPTTARKWLSYMYKVLTNVCWTRWLCTTPSFVY